MRIVYLGTPDFSVLPLKTICETSGVEVIAVVCNHDKPVGRKQILTAPPVKSFAISKNIPVLQYKSIRKEGVEDLKKLNPDLLITCAFGQILSQEIIDIPKFGVYNIHASLLPKYRGASPINYAILNGEKTTGITIMKTDVGIDTGDIILQKELDILDDETAGELFQRLSVLGADCIKEFLINFDKSFDLIKQDESLASYSKIIKKQDALIDFSKNAEDIVNLVRAYNPSPVAYTFLNGEPFKVYKAEKVNLNGNFGEVIKNENELVVGCLNGAVRLSVVQKAGGKAISDSDFLRGNKLPIGFSFVK